MLFLIRRLWVDVLTSLDVHWNELLFVVLEFEYCRHYLWYVVTNLENRTKVAGLIDILDATWSVLLAQSFFWSEGFVCKGVWIGVLRIDGSHDGVVQSFIFIVDAGYVSRNCI